MTRKAICAGTYPNEFDTREGEDKLLKMGLKREFNYKGEVEVVTPEGLGTGETVRYRANNLDVYIFELCDKELHKIQSKSLPDGRTVPARPLAFIYRQLIKNLIDTEVMAIVRGLSPGTKVFIVADHGFGRVGGEAVRFGERDLNEKSDCMYLNCMLRVAIGEADLPAKVRSNIVTFTPEQLKISSEESRVDRKTGQTFHKKFRTVAFPKVGYFFSRKGSSYNPDAYSHGGISIQELVIPMVVLRVKPREEGLLAVEAISGPKEILEGEEVEFRMHLSRVGQVAEKGEELRVDIEATYSREPDKHALPRQVIYVSSHGADAVVRFRPDPNDATESERRDGLMKRTLTISVSYREGHRPVKRTRTHSFTLQLNPEQVIRRVPPHLGSILGLTPKSMR